MSFDQKSYISDYTKQTYKMFPFRVRKDNSVIMDKLLNTRNVNKYLTNLVEKDVNHEILTIKQIKERILPVAKKHEIKEVYLFGSYARGEANNNSDVDIYCDSGDADTFSKEAELIEEFKNALGKEVDLVTIGSEMHPFFAEQLRKDLIKLCY